MKIERYENMATWPLERELTRHVYAVSRMAIFSLDFEWVRQIRAAAGSAVHNIAEGFVAGRTRSALRGFTKYVKTCEAARKART